MGVDWLDVQILETVWRRILSCEYVLLWEEMGFSSPSAMVYSLRRVCSTFLLEMDAVFLSVDRLSPYCDLAPHVYRSRDVDCDFCLRKFVDKICKMGAAFRVGVSVAGGFPSWRLDLRLDREHGGQGMPRLGGGVCLNEAIMSSYWIPRDVDVFMDTSNPETAMLIVQDAFVDLLVTMWENFSCLSILPGDLSLPDEEDSVDVLRSTFVSELDAVGLSRLTLSRAKEQYGRASHELRNCRRLWTLTVPLRSAMSPFPHTVTIWHLPNVTRSVDLPLFSHCGVSVRVRDGEWDFLATERAVDCLFHRKLQVQHMGWGGEYHSSTFLKYLSYGFTFNGVFDRTFQGGRSVHTIPSKLVVEREADSLLV